MAVFGLNLNTENPKYALDDFLFWMPQFKEAINKKTLTEKEFEKLKNIANNKIFQSIYGSDWEYAMSLCIAHYIELRLKNNRIPQTDDLRRLGGGSNYSGILSSYSVGSFSKNLDMENTLIKDEEAYFWNQTSYGASLMALLKTKAIPTIFVVTK